MCTLFTFAALALPLRQSPISCHHTCKIVIEVNDDLSRSRSKPIKYEDCPKHRETTYPSLTWHTPVRGGVASRRRNC